MSRNGAGGMVAPRRRRTDVLAYSLLVGLSLLFLAPIVMMVVGALKADEVVISDQQSWRAFVPTSFVGTENFVDAADRGLYLTSLRNSLIVTTSIVVLGLVVNSMLGYALARLRFWGDRAVLVLVVSLIIIPFEALAVPLLLIVSEAGITDTLIVQVLPFIAQPLYVYMFYSFFASLPEELDEAAIVDGAGPMTRFLRIAVPNAKPVFAAATILSFLYAWGQFLWPVMVSRTADTRVLPLGLASFKGQPPIAWGDIMAFTTLMVIPVIIVFVVFQRRFVQGIATSGLKG